VRLVLIDASPELAAAGQAARGRRIPGRAMERHTARWRGLLGSLARGEGTAGVDQAVVVDRDRAGRLTRAELLGRS
jgi:hypothetical protein